MKNTLLKNDINRMIKYYTKDINRHNEEYLRGKIKGYKEVLEMIELYEKYETHCKERYYK